MYYYPQQQQPFNAAMAGYMQPNAQINALKGRPVSSLEEARAAQIDFDGSVSIFPDIANKKIYTKQINLDGTATLNIYSLDQVTSPAQPQVYVTKEEFDALVKEIELLKSTGKEVKKQNATEPIIF